MKQEYVEKIYAGWLAKTIGIRLGAPVEGWSYEAIKEKYGELLHYPVDFKRFAADDDSNGPIFLIRALEDIAFSDASVKFGDVTSSFDSSVKSESNLEGIGQLTSQAVGEALLNYAAYESGFFWWGGYGISTEHTAYLNLRAGIPAPRSGSIQQNGHTVAEQIGGQIFIDSWGLVCPGNPDMAAKYAKKAASVTHGGNGVYGGIFVATCISHAFEEKNVRAIIEKGLSYIPKDSEYTRVVRAVMEFYDSNPNNWRDCFHYLYNNFGYDKYPGNCHIIPNIGVMILSLLYGEGKFDQTITICNMCGWDTDCNVGNVATIMGVMCGLEGIDVKWRKPVNDFLACSSVLGSFNNMDIPYGAVYMAKLAYAISGEVLPQPWDMIVNQRIDSCHFEFPGSTHAMEAMVVPARCSGDTNKVAITNSTEQAATGNRSLKITAKAKAGERLHVCKRTYLYPSDFDDSRYDPSFSPLLYPGQTIKGSVFIPESGNDCKVGLYANNALTNENFVSDMHLVTKGQWLHMSYQIPDSYSALIDAAGFVFEVESAVTEVALDFVCFIDDFYFEGTPDYSIKFSQSNIENWSHSHKPISQFTKLKGLAFLENDLLHLVSSDFAEVYTGHHNWTDYTAEFEMIPQIGTEHFVNVRVQGGMRSYAVGFVCDNKHAGESMSLASEEMTLTGGKLCIKKNKNGYCTLAETGFVWNLNQQYTIKVDVTRNHIKVAVDGKEVLDFTDNDNPYLNGCVGLSVNNGSRCAYRSLTIS